MCVFGHGDGFRAQRRWVGSRCQEEWLEGERISALTMKERNWFLSLFKLTFFLTVAACGSSPHAQCMVGFSPSTSDGFIISSESLLVEVGREFPGLSEKVQKQQLEMHCWSQLGQRANESPFEPITYCTSAGGSSPHQSERGVCSAEKSRWLPHLLRYPVPFPFIKNVQIR